MADIPGPARGTATTGRTEHATTRLVPGNSRAGRGRDDGNAIIENVNMYVFYKRFPPPGKTMGSADLIASARARTGHLGRFSPIGESADTTRPRPDRDHRTGRMPPRGRHGPGRMASVVFPAPGNPPPRDHATTRPPRSRLGGVSCFPGRGNRGIQFGPAGPPHLLASLRR